MTTSLVLDLQRMASDSDVRIGDLVRAALVVATKLGREDLGEWCHNELHGYKTTNVPPYREIRGEILARNPIHGLIPVAFEDPAMADRLAMRAVVQPISELEDIYRSHDPKGTIVMPFSQEVLNRYFASSETYRLGIVPTLVIGKAQVHGILDAVRTAVLDWSLRLEQEGVLGEGLTFSLEEKQRASAVTYNIGQFTGVLGSVTGSTFQIGDYNSIHSQLKQLGIPQEARIELESLMDEAASTPPERRKALATRGFDWLAKYGPAIGSLSDSLRGWLERLTS